MEKDEVVFVLEDLLKYGKSLNTNQYRAIGEAVKILKAAEQERGADGCDFTDPNDNPYILSGEELARAEAAARSR